MNESLIIGRIVTNEQGMEPLTDDEMARHDSATTRGLQKAVHK